jgi:uncharacterized membrane protein YkvA (DUF1232 family)
MTPDPVHGIGPRFRLLSQWRADRRAGRTKLTPWRTRLAFVAAILYFLWPIDFVPELILPVIGWIDDVGVFVIAKWVLDRDLRRYLADIAAPAAELPPAIP